MSLEIAIAALTAAVEANTAAIKGGAAAKPATTSAATGKDTKETKSKAGEHTKAEATAALNEVKEKFGTEKAVELRNKHAKVAKMADLSDPADIDALYNACKAAMKAGDDEGSGGDGL